MSDAVTFTDDEIARIEAPRTVNFWGSDHEITVQVLPTVIGDGSVLVKFVPLNTRPAYYLCRVGSEWGDDSDKAETMIDDLIEAIEAEYGRSDDCNGCPDRCPGYGDGHVKSEWPALDLDVGWASDTVSKRGEVPR